MGQVGLGDMPMPVSPLRDELGTQQPFGALVVPEVWGLEIGDYADITPAMVEAVSSTRLRPFLFYLARGARHAVDNLAVTHPERKNIVRNVHKYDEDIEDKAASGKWLLASPGAREAHVLERRETALVEVVARMAIFSSEILQPDEELLKRVMGYAWQPGLRRQKSVNILPDLVKVKQDIFGNILEAVGNQKGWDERQADLAKRSLDVRLHFAGDRVRNWRSMLKLGIDRTRKLRRIYEGRVSEAEEIIQLVQAKRSPPAANE